MFDWAEYYTLAKELFDRPEESCKRSAISRAYYAGFCTARNRLRQDGEPIPATGEAHAAVWNTFGESAEPRRLFIAENGNRLRRLRGRADYDDHIQNLSGIARQAEKYADDLLVHLASL